MSIISGHNFHFNADWCHKQARLDSLGVCGYPECARTPRDLLRGHAALVDCLAVSRCVDDRNMSLAKGIEEFL